MIKSKSILVKIFLLFLFIFISSMAGEGSVNASTYLCPYEGGDKAYLESGVRDTASDANFIYVNRYYAAKAKSGYGVEGDYVNCRASITPPKYKGISPVGAELGKITTGKDGVCGVSPRTPDIRPPVYKHSYCRDAAGIDDAGEAIINGRVVYCVNMPDKASSYGSLEDSSSCAGRKVNKAIYTPSEQNKYGWVEGSGNLFREGNCPGGGTIDDGTNDGDSSNPLAQIIWCNASTFSWYKGHGFYENTDYTSLIGTDSSGNLKNFNMRLRYFNSVGPSGIAAINITYKYPKSLFPNDSLCEQFAGGFGTPAAISTEKIALADTNGQIISDNKVKPGQEILLGVRFKNTGLTTWNGSLGVYALVNNGPSGITVAKATPPYDRWGVDNGADPKRVYYQDGSGLTEPDESTNFWFKVTLPGNLPETYTLSWRMGQTVKYEGREAQTFGDACSITLKVPQNRPFLRVGGGDVVAGARFTGYKQNEGDASPVSYTSAKATNAGIDTNGVDESFGSSSSRYAAFASGFINSLSGGQNAFYSNDFFERNNRKDLTFANKNVTGDKYGHFYGDTPPEGALPLVDVSALYDLAIKGSSANVNAALNSSDSTTVSENLTANTTNISGSKVVMVNGDLTIKNNIQYSAADTNLIVLVIGNIYIENAVTVLDGTYVAYPVDDNTGIVDTCSDFGSAGDWPTAGGSAPKIDSCPNKLTINGRLIASKVVWKRTRGTIGDASSTINSGGCLYASGGNSCAAEFIDFDPRAYFNSPFQPTEESTVGNVPTSTLDLPPVY